MTDILDIQIESGVPYSQAEAKKARKQEPHPLEPKLRAMGHNDSFFLRDRESKDVSHLVRLGDRIGVYLQAKTIKAGGEVEGVRVWRRQLDQLPKGRQERIRLKVAAGEFDPEDTGGLREEMTLVSNWQEENDGELFWRLEGEERYFKTLAGEPIAWHRENCESITEDDFYNRTRFWLYSNGAKPVCTRTREAAESLETSNITEEVSEEEYLDAVALFERQHDPGQQVPSRLRYFLNTQTDTPIRADMATAARYAAKPDVFVEISQTEYENHQPAQGDDDLDDL